ncbi:MAG: DUF4118 domain-containing protein [Actinobacteria bacterium]|nr:DUF4118 domain-containing protein [Actinomycetota bacterium]
MGTKRSQPGRRFAVGRRAHGLTARRQLLGLAVGAITLTVLTSIFTANRDSVHSSTALALYLLAVVTVAAIGGHRPAILAALAAPLLTNWFLIKPLHTWRIHDGQDVISLAVFVAVGVIVSSFVSEAARRASDAERARQEAEVLAGLAGTGGADPLQSITEHLRASFALDTVAVLRSNATGEFTVEASAGSPPLSHPDQATFCAPIDDGVTVALTGGPLTDDDHRVLRAFIQQLSKALLQSRLAATAARADLLDQAESLRTAMLRAVSHDLRTPLANIKASVSSLRQTDVDWPVATRNDFLETIEGETDRLTGVVTNLLDLSRLQAGVLRPTVRSIALEEVVPSALYSLGQRADAVELMLPDGIVDVAADPALLERVVANLVDNAIKFSPIGQCVTVRAEQQGNSVILGIVDHGPGISVGDRVKVIQPFHRLGDTGSGGGLGLGLAIADGLTVAMGGRLELRDTIGGGLTALITLPGVEPT